MRSLQIRWDFHTPWQPPSSRKVERMSRTLKKHPAKLVLEAKSPCTECLEGRTAPWKRAGLPPYGLRRVSRTQVGPLASPPWKLKTSLSGTVYGLQPPLSFLSLKGLLVQLPPLEFAVHPFCPGDLVQSKSWEGDKLRPDWEGARRVRLTTDTTVQTAEKGRAHDAQLKGPRLEEDEDRWEVCRPP